MGDAAALVEYCSENGPSILATGTLVRAASPFGLEGYLALLVGQKVPQMRRWNPPEAERQSWRKHLADCRGKAHAAIRVEEALRIVRQQIASTETTRTTNLS